jgi:nicotinamidase-related amidase
MSEQQYDRVTRDTYARAGWGGAVDRGSRPALVVVDLTRGFTEPQFEAGAELTDVVEATSRLMAVGHEHDIPVFLTRIVFQPAEIEPGVVTWLTKASGMRAMVEGSDAIAMDPRLPVGAGDVIIDKKGASGFHGTTLASLLTARGCNTIVVCGATTSGCIRATAVDAVQLGFSVLVPRDAVGDRAIGPHTANLFDIQAKYGDVIDLDDALNYLATARATIRTSRATDAVPPSGASG